MSEAESKTERSKGVEFRVCTETDLHAVQQLANELYLSDANTRHVQPNIRLTFRELSQKPDKGRLIVFEANDQIIGYCIIIFFWSNEYSGDIVEIDELYIAEKWRGAGIGTELFAWFESVFAGTVAGFSLQVAHHNTGAIRLYERLGFSLSRNQHMIRVLPKE